MISRSISSFFRVNLETFPIAGIIGPRQVGKTTFVKSYFKSNPSIFTYLDLDLQSDKAKLANAQYFLEAQENKTVILDEIQLMPEIFGLLKALVDKNKQVGRFIILGSASPKLLRKSSDALTGRIGYVEMHPFNIEEVNIENQTNLWLRGGFPDAFLANTEEKWQLITNNFIKTYIERELPELGLPASSNTTYRLLSMLSSSNGQLLNLSAISKSLGLSVNTIKSYLQILESSFLIRLLPPYFINIKKRLTKTPKVYLRDTGILHNLLGIESFNDLMGNQNLGYSWEGFVIQQIIACAPPNLDFAFYRTQDGTEVDLVILKGDKPKYSIEIKLNSNFKLSKGNSIAYKDIGAEKNFVITSGNENYPFNEAVEVIGLHQFCREYLIR